MKSLKNKIKTVGLASLGLAMLWSCSEVLDETPRSIYDPGFFQTDKGIEGGLTSLYSHLRNVYGNGYYMNIQETGTDEYTYGQSADGNLRTQTSLALAPLLLQAVVQMCCGTTCSLI